MGSGFPRRVVALTFLPLMAISFLPCAAEPSSNDKPTVHLLIFLSEDCPHCELVERPAQDELSRSTGCIINPHYFDIEEMKNYRLLVYLERKYGDTDNEMPVVFVAKHVLGGVGEIEKELERLIQAAAAAGGTGAIELPSEEEITAGLLPKRPRSEVHLAYFEEPGCRACRRVEHMIRYYENKFSGVVVRRFVSTKRRNKVLLEALCERTGVPEGIRLIVPAVFVGKDALIEDDITEQSLSRLLEKYRTAGSVRLWDVDSAELDEARKRLQERWRRIGVLAVMAGGLVDGVNPCAFATIVFFVTFLAARGWSRRQILRIGAAFCGGVFCAYFAIGMGLSEVLLQLEALPTLAVIVRWAIIGLVFILAAVSLYDALVAWRGRSDSMMLKVPAKLRTRTNLLITRGSRSAYLGPASFLLGLIISLLELVCTGQMYLPLIQFMLMVSAERVQTMGLLLLYDLAFVVPLLVVFGAAFVGVRSGSFTALLKRHVVPAKLLLTGFFSGLGVAMLALGT